MAKWIESAVSVEDENLDATALLRKIERACRTCYRSEDKVAEGSAERLIRSCIARGHESPLEHASITFRIICDRGVSHEIVRHRLASYSQESTRYCNYSKDKFGNELTFIYPAWYKEKTDKYLGLWLDLTTACENAEHSYFAMLANGAKPEEARAVLPNCLRTELVMTMNMRELRHFLRLRLSPAAHPDIRQVAGKMLKLLHSDYPQLDVLFADIEVPNV